MNYDPNIYIATLVPEITRRCNLACRHCLRGPARDIDMSPAIIHRTLQNITEIDAITLSGGEPSLYIPGIKKVLKTCQDYNIDVHSFAIITNGLNVNNKFLHALIDWYTLVCDADKDEISAVMITDDEYHKKVPDTNRRKLEGLSFSHNYPGTNYILNEGNARKLTGIEKQEPFDYITRLSEPDNKNDNLEDIDIYYDSRSNHLDLHYPALYISALGEIKLGCDNSYANMQHYIGNLKNKTLGEMLIFLASEVNHPENTPSIHEKIYKILQEQQDANEYELRLYGNALLLANKNNNDQYTYSYQKGCKSRVLLTGDTDHDSIPEVAHIFATLLFEHDLKLDEDYYKQKD